MFRPEWTEFLVAAGHGHFDIYWISIRLASDWWPASNERQRDRIQLAHRFFLLFFFYFILFLFFRRWLFNWLQIERVMEHVCRNRLNYI